VYPSDLKVSELVPIGDDRLIVLERASATTKLYVVQLDPERALDGKHLDVATRPSVEELSGQDRSLPGLRSLAKTLILTTDDLPDVEPRAEADQASAFRHLTEAAECRMVDPCHQFI
jgi:hypothetical protein